MTVLSDQTMVRLHTKYIIYFVWSNTTLSAKAVHTHLFWVTVVLTYGIAIVKLFMRYERQAADDQRYAMGTGWLIRPDLLVTAGHCAYDWSQMEGKGFGRAIEIKAYIGYNGKSSVGTANVQFRTGAKIVTTEGWLRSCANLATIIR